MVPRCRSVNCTMWKFSREAGRFRIGMSTSRTSGMRTVFQKAMPPRSRPTTATSADVLRATSSRRGARVNRAAGRAAAVRSRRAAWSSISRMAQAVHRQTRRMAQVGRARPRLRKGFMASSIPVPVRQINPSPSLRTRRPGSERTSHARARLPASPAKASRVRKPTVYIRFRKKTLRSGMTRPWNRTKLVPAQNALSGAADRAKHETRMAPA